ncbi:hypothetical protein AGABI1DRAFT_111777 [Agaricus bisporus var. burnettii JB137-S8]|uniref:NACHT domain-containing protein n=1 Tax=Agaricus bisporus var. burnettii (strain JB137-S8 / ATCC MYA-4627 / FGSC 10392) TaxID=597362 RepID=K5W3T7_AGABU|nr:uncharacterized protein AGABI1DRAFT_111777 [Agaricus bisporus var. burnettii JB137-S8]EKM81459.1 hypothetical protein AGABI1DRAFT_111777 [Agaricus bisporus var. burnettii JB137-S8]
MPFDPPNPISLSSRLHPKRRPLSPSTDVDVDHPKKRQRTEKDSHSNIVDDNLPVHHANLAGSAVFYTLSHGRAVFRLLEAYTMLEATKDSSAQYPPPGCYPETRLKLTAKLKAWLFGEMAKWRMLWVRGRAGTGKSAIAQTFAESCDGWGRHGGSYFFSRIAGRTKLETVIPTLVYQLAHAIPEYKALISTELANNSLLLRNSPIVQFKRLIIEPLSALQRQCPREPMIIILDGLDECKGEDAQLKILEMISDSLRTSLDLPLRWLIFSRPEPHLKRTFFQIQDCAREELTIDAECRDDVEHYARGRVLKFKATYSDVTPTDWPSQEDFQKLVTAVSGHFVLAATSLNYIGDPDKANPPAQLDALLKFMYRSEVSLADPLESLDMLYSWILGHISPILFGTTWRILAHLFHHSELRPYLQIDGSAQALYNLLRLEPSIFYEALRELRPIMRIPKPEDAARYQVQFHHVSFQDFILDPKRAKEFFIEKQKMQVDILKSVLYWHDIDVKHFHADDQIYDYTHRHGSLPGLTWIPAKHKQLLVDSQAIAKYIERNYFDLVSNIRWEGIDEELLAHIYNLDFKHWPASYIYHLTKSARLESESSNSFVRTVPSSPTDHQLLEYLNQMIKHGVANPATFPLGQPFNDSNTWARDYYLIGHGVKSVVVLMTKSPAQWVQRIHSFHSDKEPSEEQISKFNHDLKELKWDEEKARECIDHYIHSQLPE